MRSAVILVIVLIALVGGFALFMLTQGSTRKYGGVQVVTPTTLPRPVASTQGDAQLGSGDNIFLVSFDPKTGNPASEFKADRYDPPVGNKLHVIHPISRFFQKNGQVMQIAASYGDFVMGETVKKPGQLQAFSNQPPQTGILHDVTLSVLDDDKTTVANTTVTLPIMAFDSDTLRMNSIDWKNGDLIVPADQVPVTVRGRDYDFDGQGLTLRYNQREQRLEFLEVAHGQRLLIKNTKAFGTLPTPAIPSPGAQGALPAAPLMLNGRPLELAAADETTAPRLSAQEAELHRQKRAAATRPVSAATAERRARARAATRPVVLATSRPTREPVAYRARFANDVHIKQGDVPIGTADEMFATFTFDQEKGTATTQPLAAETPAVTLAPAPVIPPTDDAAPRASVARAPSTVPAPTAVTPATEAPIAPPAAGVETQTADAATDADLEPIEIKWTGKLTVIPQTMAESGLRSMADRIVEFSGSPVHLESGGAAVDAPYVWAALDGDRFKAVGNDRFPQILLHNADGGKLSASSIEADGDTVLIHGQSIAESLVSNSDGSVSKIISRWTDRATLHLLTTPSETRTIDRATFQGDVDVRHPQLHLNGDALSLGFELPNGQKDSVLKTVHVDGHVKAAITGDNGAVQNIAARVLDLGTAVQLDGSITISQLHANGDVVAQSADQKLLTDDLTAALSATGEAKNTGGLGQIDVDHMTATGNVTFSTTEGTYASADLLKVDRDGATQKISLTGVPAIVKTADATVSGKLIKLDGDGSHATVDGAGSMDSIANARAGKPSTPVHVTWSQSLQYDAEKLTAQVLGDVMVASTSKVGAIQHATGPVMDITLASPPATQPSQAAKPPATTQSRLTGLGARKVNIQTMLLHGDADKPDAVEVSSVSYAPDDNTRLLKRTHLFTASIRIDMTPSGEVSQMTAPSPGKLLYEDRTGPTPTTKPSVAASTPATAPTLVARGTVAMQWQKSLTYDPTKQTAILDGDVVVVHQAPGQEMMRMLAPRLVAEFENADSSDLKQVVADKGATFIGKSFRFDAATAIYQPKADRIIAQGSARQPIELFDEAGKLSRGSIGELWWNLRTNQPERVVNVTGQINR